MTYSRIIRYFFIFIFIIIIISGCFKKDKDLLNEDSEKTLTYWMELHDNVSSIVNNFGDLPFAKELQKQTGINIKYVHPSKGQEKEEFSIMIASGKTTDIIEYSWQRYPGGPNNAIDNDVIYELNQFIENYAPNLSSFLDSNPSIDKQVKTDKGDYYVFPFIRNEKILQYTSGPIIRKDWLDDLGLQVPETVDEWYIMLKAFKNVKKASAPLSCQVRLNTDTHTVIPDLYRIFMGAFNYQNYFYQENNIVKYGPIEPGRKEFLNTMARWYKEGLLDEYFTSIDKDTLDSKILNGETGATYGSGGGNMGSWLYEMKTKNPEFDLVAAKYPVKNKGDISIIGHSTNEYTISSGHAAISKNCSYPDTAAKFLDYAYSKQGHMLYNFGIYNDSYIIKDGNPIYTEKILNPSDKLSIAQRISMYSRGNTNGPFIQDKRYIEQFYSLPQQKNALVVWSDNQNEKTLLPPITSNSSESSDLAIIMNDIQRYVDDMTIKFILGVEPIENYDGYILNIKNMGIDRAINIMQQALDRYNNR